MKRTFLGWTIIVSFILASSFAFAQEETATEEKTNEAVQEETPLVPVETDTKAVEATEPAPAAADETAVETVEEMPAEQEPVEQEPEEQEFEEDDLSIEDLDMEGLEDLEQIEGDEEGYLAEEEQVKFFELHGYFRLRADLFHQLDIGVYNELRPLGDAGTTTADQDAWNDDRKENTIGTTNMRLRLNPILNISEDIKIKMQIDVLDNIVLGTTPDTYLRGGPGGLASGISGFSTSQVSPIAGANAQSDSISIKRVWAEIRTPVGEIRFGRMPSHWGMGIFINDGNSIDSDYGDTVDRIMFGTKLFEHTLFAGMDFVNEGITNESAFEFYGQSKDATQLDDVQQVVFGFARKHNDAEAEELLENGDVVVDYGFYNVVRWQSYSLENATTGGSNVPYGSTPAGDFASRQNLRSKLIERDLLMYIGDIWFKLLYKGFHLELEGVYIHGTIGDAAADSGTQAENERKGIAPTRLTLDQYALALKADYKFLDDALKLGVEWGLASGDPYQGFGQYPYENKQYADSEYKRTKNGANIEDHSVNNFRFDPDYHIDLILFREIIGMVTDATYLKPSIQYNILPTIGARLDLILSWAMEPDSTPSYEHMKFESMEDVVGGLPVERLPSRFLGTELDLEIFYKSFDGFGASLQYGVFFPGQAFGYWDADYVNADGIREPTWFSAPNIAQTVQFRMSVEF